MSYRTKVKSVSVEKTVTAGSSSSLVNLTIPMKKGTIIDKIRFTPPTNGYGDTVILDISINGVSKKTSNAMRNFQVSSTENEMLGTSAPDIHPYIKSPPKTKTIPQYEASRILVDESEFKFSCTVSIPSSSSSSVKQGATFEIIYLEWEDE